ncbi:hypothetical protein CDAR_430781 [Caerostris darwini]|uniref:Uncharacterized protein n=1 Tax=Caerostris darwini TaxID=1538125 RepID=A0AAV4Q4I0_9ARAC|nr:hypothetical protein CDAR_430781 [Caerostris darwini]
MQTHSLQGRLPESGQVRGGHTLDIPTPFWTLSYDCLLLSLITSEDDGTGFSVHWSRCFLFRVPPAVFSPGMGFPTHLGELGILRDALLLFYFGSFVN